MEKRTCFANRVAVLATMHRKEQAIAPLLKEKLGLSVLVPDSFNTDRFGTFTREIKRLGTQLEAARLKAQKALELTGETLAIASEGAFYPHPAFPYLACDRELVLLVDSTHNFEIAGYEISTQTNYSHQLVRTVSEAWEFAHKVGFPDHALVVMFEQNSQCKDEIFKGITTPEELNEVVQFVLKNSRDRTAHLETDMRAMYNPTRMRVIAQATQNLLQKIQQTCPNCASPGFDIVEQKPGLPCAACSFPTSLIRSAIYQCRKCNFRQEKFFPQGREFADPAQCLYCNP
jgi:hypothetical protein